MSKYIINLTCDFIFLATQLITLNFYSGFAFCACLGYEALKNKLDHVICGDEKTKQEAKENRTTPEAVKAARHAQKAKPE